MAVTQTTPAEAHEILNSDAEAVYLDVRSEAEFEKGHPAGAYNVPVVFLEAGAAAQPNPDFVAVVSRHFALERKLIVGCQSGVRSQRACDLLAQAGFSDLSNVRGGFGGARDRSGQVVAAGWKDSGLPVATGQPQAHAYADLSSGD